ncbi:pectate lyase family protein [Thalassobellus sediminis]|uniref:pectate lyase family protein n=1 Tax=Thalassobellus sediminis TaxID=3367753 RepID=UPI0037A5F5E1
MKTLKSLLGYFVLVIVLILNVQCQEKTEKQIVKVDFDFSGRKLKEVSDPNYESWVIEEQKEAEKTFGDVSVKLKGDFSSKWFKVGIQAPHYNRLGSDGLATGDTLEMSISGLKTGKHSLLTFHNTFDKIEAKIFPDIKIYVNDKLSETVQPSNRAFSKIGCGTGYVTFNAKTNEDVLIKFVMDLGGEVVRPRFYIWQMIMNGFEIDTPDLKKQAHTPLPESKDEHVVFEDDLQLQWQSPKGTVSHKLYFGEDEKAILEANENTSEFKGVLTENKFNVNNLYSMDTYYWRVDEVDAEGNETQGNVWSFKPAQLAFPEAEGYGRFAIGGRGGKVVEVTNLNDDGPGSLRDAVNQDIGPRTIVFNVSGNIELKSRLVVNQPYTTIAGQTAPGEGITITRAPIGLTGNDGIVRFLKVRIGAGKTFDGMGLTGANNSIIDHCSISWTIDESFSSRSAHNITLQRTLISEALNLADHHKYGNGAMHGYAATIGGDIGSFHHNLLAHNYGRNWSLGGGLNGDGYYAGKLDIRNNVVYNWGKRATDGGASEVNFVNNYYKPGASTKFFYALKVQHEGLGKGMQQYFFRGNVMPGHFDENSQENGATIRLSKGAIVDFETFVEKPFFESFVKTQSASAAYKNVLSDVGANQPFFDNHDTRIVDETLKGSYTFKGSKSGFPGMIDTQEDTGGWPEFVSKIRSDDWDTDHDGLPNWWEEIHGLNTQSPSNDFSDSNADDDKNGYTELEEYLHWMAQPHYFITLDEAKDVSLNNYFKGYEKNPVYSFLDEKNCNVSIEDRTIQFKAIEKGLASFKITVKDADGDSMSRIINLFVK